MGQSSLKCLIKAETFKIDLLKQLEYFSVGNAYNMLAVFNMLADTLLKQHHIYRFVKVDISVQAGN